MKKVFAISILLLLCCCVFMACDKPQNDCNHADEEWIVATEAGCTTAGMRLIKCDKCGEKTEVIPAVGHKWEEATCLNAKTCSVCNKIEGEPLGHEYEASVKEAATCTTAGVILNACIRCNDSYEESSKMLGHTNTLQSSGADICSTCKKETYTTYSVKALAGIYQSLKAPSSAKISSIYAGSTTWESKPSIVVVISLSAQNSYGGMTSGEYVAMFDLATGSAISYDLVEAMQDKADYYNDMADLFGYEYLSKANEYLNKKIVALRYRTQKVSTLEIQDLEYIDPIARKSSGMFN